MVFILPLLPFVAFVCGYIFIASSSALFVLPATLMLPNLCRLPKTVPQGALGK